MLSKNFEYTGHLPYFFQIALPTMVAPQSATAWRSVKRSLADDAVAQALVRHAAFVGGLGGGGEPALVNAAAVGAVGVGVVGMQLDAQAGLEEGARHPGGREAQQAAGVLQRGFDDGLGRSW